MASLIIARYGEVHLKGKNRNYFLRKLTENLRRAVGNDYKVTLQDGRYLFEDFKKGETFLVQKIAKVFGITSVSPCEVVTHKEILKFIKNSPFCNNLVLQENWAALPRKGGGDVVEGGFFSFRVNVNRADKKFPHKSMEFAAMCGEVILKANKNARVDLHNPDVTINIDIRENDKAFVYHKVIQGVGGMPVGTAGKAFVLLSGGIDSPVAAWLAQKRGLTVECVHFASPPYTSGLALDKVRRLAGDLKLHVVPFTKIQQEIREKCSEDYLITIMRRFMIRISKQIAENNNGDCLVTGENLGQVASQTIQGITTNNLVAGDMPILRPLITFDKSEIITLAKKIGTYDISIEPYQDCCTVFVPSAPVISPTIKRCEIEERKLDVDGLVSEAMENLDKI